MEGLVINSMESCNKVLKNPEDFNARADFMWTATLALNGLTGAGLGKVGFPMHMIEHSLSAFYNVPHGAGLSAIIPGWMHFHAPLKPARFAQFAERVFDIREGNDLEKAVQGIIQLKAWFRHVQSPSTLTELKIPTNEFDKIAENSMTLAKVWRMQGYDTAKIVTILQASL